jgi:hypothetical protein
MPLIPYVSPVFTKQCQHSRDKYKRWHNNMHDSHSYRQIIILIMNSISTKSEPVTMWPIKAPAIRDTGFSANTKARTYKSSRLLFEKFLASKVQIWDGEDVTHCTKRPCLKLAISLLKMCMYKYKNESWWEWQLFLTTLTANFHSLSSTLNWF